MANTLSPRAPGDLAAGISRRKQRQRRLHSSRVLHQNAIKTRVQSGCIPRFAIAGSESLAKTLLIGPAVRGAAIRIPN